MRREFDKPGVKTNTVFGSEPNILEDETKTGGCDWIGLGETRKNRNVN